MKRESLKGVSAILLVILSINFLCAANIFSEGVYENTQSPGVYFSGEKEIQENPEQGLMKAMALDFNPITIIWPEPGYYYVTDYFLLEVSTATPSTCTYSLNNGPEISMEDNETEHSVFIYDLVDNMESDEPYFIDFYCNDGSEITNAYTYFWINTTHLDAYLIRGNLGEWDFLSSEQIWYDNYSNNGEVVKAYASYYQKGEEYDSAMVFIFANKTSLEKYVKEELAGSIQVIGGKNFYVDYDEGKMLGWSSGNHFILNEIFPEEGSLPSNLQNPNEIISPYLEKYPNDLKNGVCGDGKVNVLNLNGKKEDCDKNSEILSCGTNNTGECKLGQKIRKCKLDCTWESFGACNATNSKPEFCDDGKDNDCDGVIDEGCDKFLILSPNKSIYNTTKIILNLNSTYKFSKIEYADNPIESTRFTLLCTNCSNVSKTILLREGNHTLEFKGNLNNGTTIINKVKFIIDTKAPVISLVKPMSMKYTNGSGFYVKYNEENCKTLKLIINNTEVKSMNCKSGKIVEESFFQNISKYNNKTVSYRFKIIDIAGNTKESRNTTIKVDTTSPKINNFKAEKSGNYITFNMSILNEDKISFGSVQYIDNSELIPKWKPLCTSLRNNVCTKKIYFKAGNHNIIVRALDDAGNSESKSTSILI